MASAGEPVFVLWSEHITEWDNREATQLVHVHATYPRWKFVKDSRIKAIMTTKNVELSEEQRRIKKLALPGFVSDPMDPTAAQKEEQLKKARQKDLDGTRKSASPVVAKVHSTIPPKRNAETASKGRSAKRAKKEESTAPLAKEDKGKLNDLKRDLRASEELVEMQTARITRLEGKEDLQKESYDELTEKSEEKLEDYDNLRS